MMEIMLKECQSNSLKDLFKKILSDTVSKTITEECSKIFPLQNVMVHKAKVLKKPKFDLTKLMELYQEDKSEAMVAPSASENLLAETDK
jgi:small subunit ribosomal protein S3Ae